jgi:sulfate permease
MLTIYILPLIAAMFLAVNMGASGTAPSFSTSYGANLIRKDLIPGLFGLFVFTGAVLAGKNVVVTIGRDILPSEVVGLNLTVIVLLSISLSLFFANILKVPQSTSQSTVFALAGPALFLNVLQTKRLFFEIIPTWFITPIIAFLLAYTIGRFLYVPVVKKKIEIFSVFNRGKIVRYFVIGTSCYVAFSIGSNNVANAVGPILAMTTNMLDVAFGSESYMLLMLVLIFMMAPLFGIGSSFMGHRVLTTTAKEIVNFGPLGASMISIITGSLLLAASLIRGIPTSLVQMNTAAIIGLGIVKTGFRSTVQDAPLVRIFTVWIIAPLIALILSLTMTFVADRVGLL